MFNVPDGYSGVDRPSEHVYLECQRGHVWSTIVHYEYGGTHVERPECPHCDMDGEYSDADAANSHAYKERCNVCGDWVDVDDLNDDICVDCENGEAIVSN